MTSKARFVDPLDFMNSSVSTDSNSPDRCNLAACFSVASQSVPSLPSKIDRTFKAAVSEFVPLRRENDRPSKKPYALCSNPTHKPPERAANKLVTRLLRTSATE